MAPSLAASHPSAIILARGPKSPPKLPWTKLQYLRFPKETGFHICTSARLNSGNITVSGAKSVRAGKRQLTPEHFGSATLGGQEPVMKWLTYIISSLACLDYFGVLDLPPLIQIRPVLCDRPVEGLGSDTTDDLGLPSERCVANAHHPGTTDTKVFANAKCLRGPFRAAIRTRRRVHTSVVYQKDGGGGGGGSDGDSHLWYLVGVYDACTSLYESRAFPKGHFWAYLSPSLLVGVALPAGYVYIGSKQASESLPPTLKRARTLRPKGKSIMNMWGAIFMVSAAAAGTLAWSATEGSG
ncbi:uncharacterized protein PG986_011083 [Apiospora aurea]|uniref:Uncharacterized protein n=1 Tax=Apiospora aurea TaxID=335848 RepID=A0ABR1Q4A1_9PEZI